MLSTRTVGVTVLVLVLVAGLLLAAVWGLQRQLIYFPSGARVPAVSEVLPGAREVRLHTADGLDLGAWYLPANGPASGSGRDVAVLVANGNAGDRSLRAPLAAALSRAGMAVLLFDYRGYGGNPGGPSEAGLALDVRAAHRFLAGEHRTLLYFGESLGAAVVTELATEHPPAGLFLRSPFVDLAAVGRAHYPYLPVGALLRDRYPVASRIATVAVPTTVLYGSADRIVPPEQSRAVAAAAGGPTVQVEVRGADHNDRALLDGAELVRAVTELAERATT